VNAAHPGDLRRGVGRLVRALGPARAAGQPADVAPSYVFLASDDAVYMTGQVLDPNGGNPVAG
jgi:NAD(P)-dependent dehydrogenase (short-subunit alcohol dehydrogenase family)